MSKFNHAICWTCWEKEHPEKEPYRIIDPDDERCCFCGEPTNSGIYVRKDPKDLPHCKGHE